MPTRRLIFVGDSGFAVLDLLASVRRHCIVVSRLRLDANLYAPPPPRGPRTLGRPTAKGEPLAKLKIIAEDVTTVWCRTMASEWYGNSRCELDLASGPGSEITPLRWVGTVRFAAAAAAPTFIAASAIILDPGDVLTVVASASADASLADVAVTLGGSLTA